MHTNHDKGGGFGNGFILGLIVGGLLVFILGTKKGRRLLKILTEEGLEGVAELEEYLEEKAQEKKEMPKTVVKNAPVVVAKPLEIIPDASDDIDELEEDLSHMVEEKPKAVRRFFRGISKRN